MQTLILTLCFLWRFLVLPSTSLCLAFVTVLVLNPWHYEVEQGRESQALLVSPFCGAWLLQHARQAGLAEGC